MSYKPRPNPKTCCERYQKHLSAYSMKSFNKTCPNATKMAPQNSNKNTSSSTGKLCNISKLAKPKKTAKSDFIIHDTCSRNSLPLSKNNHCKTCGDMAHTFQKAQEKTFFRETYEKNYEAVEKTCSKAQNVKRATAQDKFFIKLNGTKYEGVEQYYKNENYLTSTASIQGADCFRKVSSLNTINEQSEDSTSSVNSSESSEDEIEIIESDIKDLKKFRHDNYFDCHSASSNLKKKPSVTSLDNHKCIYRFYLNERLFPVPVNRDYNNFIRCTDCHLPLESSDSKFENLTGTIQAKVKINGQLQDMMLMLPVKKSLIIKERRQELQENKEEDDNLYFGIVKLSMEGDSMFNRNLPSNSLALKYQKGYQEHTINNKYQYECIKDNDVIII